MPITIIFNLITLGLLCIACIIVYLISNMFNESIMELERKVNNIENTLKEGTLL